MQGKKKLSKNMAYTAMFLAISVIISLVESASGINSLIPFPGVRLGLCNIAITACFYTVSRTGALAVTLVRPMFLFLFSGNPISLAMSLGGSSLSYLSLHFTHKANGKIISFSGVSTVSAACHSIGQTAVACFAMRDTALLLYLPVFCALSSVVGFALGIVMNIVLPRIERAVGKEVGA